MLYLVTTNKGKFLEAKAVIPELEQLDVEVDEIKSLDAHETIMKKAAAAYAIAKKPIIVEDTCLYFKAFNNFPGTYTKFAYNTIGLEGCLKLLEGKNRNARFVTLVAYTDGKTTEIFEGETKGKLTEKPMTTVSEKLPYDSVFVPEGFDKVYGLLSREETKQVKHRAKAFQKLKEWLER